MTMNTLQLIVCIVLFEFVCLFHRTNGCLRVGYSCYSRTKCYHKPLLVDTTRGQELTVMLSSISGMERLRDVNSPQYHAACWLIHDDERQVNASDDGPRVIQRYVLALLYFSLDGSYWSRHYHFLSPRDECEWKEVSMYLGIGISCNELGNVDTISLEKNRLGGTIPQELSRLSHIESIDLSYGKIEGSIPSELTYLTNLKNFSANSNFITGTIPASITKLESIENIKLGYNALTGSITELSTSLMTLDVQFNVLTGTLPSQLGDLTSLTLLDLKSNQFSGTIPESFGNMTALTGVFFNDNHFSGSIPQQNLEHLTDLEILWSGENDLSGTLPSILFNLPRLSYLNMGNNHLSGTIPYQVANESTLRTLHLDSNQLTGTISSQLFTATKSLTTLFLQDNRLSGELPLEITGLESLRDVALHENDLTGIIPFESCEQFKSLTADCDSPRKVLCPCCTSCHGMFSEQEDDDIMGCASSKLTVTFEKLKIGQGVAFRLTNEAGEKLADPTLFANESTLSYSMCISTTDCFQIRPNTDSEMDVKIVVDEEIIFQKHMTEWHDFRQRFGSASNGILQKDTCDNLNICNVEIKVNSTERELVNTLTKIQYIDFNDPLSEEYQALCTWLNYVGKMDFKESEKLQNYFLTIFYYSTNGQEWNNSTFWLSDEHYCNWYGVKCNSYNIVTSISMDSNGLKGTLSSSIGELRGLEELSLSHNQLKGTIPESLGVKLTNLEQCNMSHNDLVGGIPPGFQYLKNLIQLDLSYNLFSDKLPVDIGQLKKLESLNLFDNEFYGNLPDSFYELTNLIYLNLGSNLFAGTVDKIRTFENLEYLDLSDNGFTGFLPLSDRQGHLKVVKLSGNNFRGTISSTIEKSQLLEEVLLYDNQLTGSLPSQIGNLPNLLKFSASYNKLKGSIPATIGNAKNLTLLHLHSNELEGRADFFDYPFDFITDCGGVFHSPALVQCSNCSSCCNIEGTCLRTNSTWPRSFIKSLELPPWFCMYVLILIGCASTIAIFSVYHFTVMKRGLNCIVCDKFQEESVYRLFLCSDLRATCVVVIVVVLQLSIVKIFLRLSDFSQNQNDWNYSLSCPNDDLTCSSTRYLTTFGWIIFSCIYFVYIAKDILEGLQMIYESVRMSFMRGIVAGFIVLLVSISTTSASILYNYATANSDSDIIRDAVILLFLIEIDEKVYTILNRAFSVWVSEKERQISNILQEYLSLEDEHHDDDDDDDDGEVTPDEEQATETNPTSVTSTIFDVPKEMDCRHNNNKKKHHHRHHHHHHHETKVIEERVISLVMDDDNNISMEYTNDDDDDDHNNNNDDDEGILIRDNNSHTNDDDNDECKEKNNKKVMDELKLSNDQQWKSVYELQRSNNEQNRLIDELKLSNDELTYSNNELTNVVNQLMKELYAMKQEMEHIKVVNNNRY